MQITLSQRGRSRMQQRSIPMAIIDILQECGSASRSCGAERLSFDKAAKRRLEEKFGSKRGMKFIERYFNTYAVVSDNGILITAGHRSRGFRRDI